MFSLRELNHVMRMDYPKNKIVRWHPGHMELIHFNEFDKDNFLRHPQNLDNFYRYAETGLAFTALSDGIIYAMFGLWQKWKGVSEAWLIPSNKINKKTIAFHRGVLRFFEHYAYKTGTKRIQVTVNSLNVQAEKYIERCYFKKEAEMKYYGLNGETYFLYSRFFL